MKSVDGKLGQLQILRDLFEEGKTEVSQATHKRLSSQLRVACGRKFDGVLFAFTGRPYTVSFSMYVLNFEIAKILSK